MVADNSYQPQQRSTRLMRSCHSLDRLSATFDDHRLIDHAGLLLPATLAQHLGLGELVDAHGRT